MPELQESEATLGECSIHEGMRFGSSTMTDSNAPNPVTALMNHVSERSDDAVPAGGAVAMLTAGDGFHAALPGMSSGSHRCVKQMCLQENTQSSECTSLQTCRATDLADSFTQSITPPNSAIPQSALSCNPENVDTKNVSADSVIASPSQSDTQINACKTIDIDAIDANGQFISHSKQIKQNESAIFATAEKGIGFDCPSQSLHDLCLQAERLSEVHRRESIVCEEWREQFLLHEASTRGGIDRTFKHASGRALDRKKTLILELNTVCDRKMEGYERRHAALLEFEKKLDDIKEEMVNIIGTPCTPDPENPEKVQDFKNECTSGVNKSVVDMLSSRFASLCKSYEHIKSPDQRCLLDNPYVSYTCHGRTESTRIFLKHGSIHTSAAIAGASTVSGDGLRRCVVGKSTTAKLTLRDATGAPIPHEKGLREHVSTVMRKENTAKGMEIGSNKSRNTGTFVSVRVSEGAAAKTGVFDLVYRVSSPGKYSLTVSLFHQDVRGSPFSVIAMPDSSAASHSRCRSSGESIPVTTHQPDCQHRKSMSSLSSASRRCMSSTSPRPPSKRGGLSSCRRPSSAATSTSSVFTNTSSTPETITAFDNPCYLGYLGRRGRGACEFSNPQGVAVLPGDSKFVVADSSNQNVQVIEWLTDNSTEIYGNDMCAPHSSKEPVFLEDCSSGKLEAGWSDLTNTSLSVPDSIQSSSSITEGHTPKCDSHSSPCSETSPLHVHQEPGLTKSAALSTIQNINDTVVGANNPPQCELAQRSSHIDEGTVGPNHTDRQIVGERGSLLAAMSSRGREPGQILRPTGVAVTSRGNLIVADYETKWINVFGADGKFKKRFGAGKLSGPKGVAVSKTGDIYVADNKGNKLLKFTATGKLVTVIQNGGGVTFKGPHYVAISSCGDLYVTDFHSDSIKVLTEDGLFRFSFGSGGSGDGQFNSPTGIAIDEEDNVLVADWGNSRIQIFDEVGVFLRHVDTTGVELFGPQAIAILGKSRVIVSDSGHHCLKMFSYKL